MELFSNILQNENIEIKNKNEIENIVIRYKLSFLFVGGGRGGISLPTPFKNDAMHLLLLPENPTPMIIFRQDGCRSRIKSVSGDICRKHCIECVYSERLMMCSRYVHVWKTVL